KVCRVYDGKEEVQVVCGGSNVREGMKCAFARIGAKVRWHGDEEMVLAKVNIRGKESHGMICAAEELGLALGHEKEREIMDLGGVEADVGTPLAQALRADDVFFDVDNKAINHRPDLWGHLGVARELAAIYHKPFAMPEPPRLVGGRPWALKVRIEAGKMCPRYQAVVVENVRVAPSPEWMQRRLRACGIRPINNVVDVTNWVMMELGQPMHAFDVGRLARPGKDAVAIQVRPAQRGEKMFALDGQTYALTPDMLVIADEKHPIAVAGVIGGEKTGTTEKTNTILFESANFNALSVRKTAQALGTRTESSARFEKMLDPTVTSLALARAVELLRELSPDCAVASPVADVGTWRLPSAAVKLSVEKTQTVLGVKIPAAKIKSILQEIGC
ncbi:MAG: phenylalanine--tRNA ligase subunit beta, partial [Patescibacteria group bacterium]